MSTDALNEHLKPEYDLTKLKVRRVGKGRLDHIVRLDENDELLPHCDLDYSKSKPNRFAERYTKRNASGSATKKGDSDEKHASRESE